MIAALQGALRRLFMLVEALFNRAFGDRLNPFYHLGSITFFLFWIVAVTGIYLFIFFDTGVTDAYASVAWLSRDHWWHAGIARSRRMSSRPDIPGRRRSVMTRSGEKTGACSSASSAVEVSWSE